MHTALCVVEDFAKLLKIMGNYTVEVCVVIMSVLNRF